MERKTRLACGLLFYFFSPSLFQVILAISYRQCRFVNFLCHTQTKHNIEREITASRATIHEMTMTTTTTADDRSVGHAHQNIHKAILEMTRRHERMMKKKKTEPNEIKNSASKPEIDTESV